MHSRLDKLEKDLNFLSAMQGLLMPDGDSSGSGGGSGPLPPAVRHSGPNSIKRIPSEVEAGIHALVAQQCQKVRDRFQARNNCVGLGLSELSSHLQMQLRERDRGRERDYQEKDSKNKNMNFQMQQYLNNNQNHAHAHGSNVNVTVATAAAAAASKTSTNCGCVLHRKCNKMGPQTKQRMMDNIPEVEAEAAAAAAGIGAGGASGDDVQHSAKVEALKYELKFERDRRAELQDVSKRVVLKLQKTEEELRREAKTKSSLLIETLELKNHIQDYIERVQRLEAEIKNCKAEHSTCGEKIQTLNTEKLKLQEELLKLTIQLEQDTATFKKESTELRKQLTETQVKLDSAQSQENLALRESKSAKEDSRKLQFQIEQLLEKCVRLEKEKERLLNKLADSSTKAKEAESQLRLVHDQLNKLQSQFQEQQVHHGALLQKSESKLSQQRKIVSTQMDQCYSLLAKTKNMLSQLQYDKQGLQQSLEQQQTENQRLVQQLSVSHTKLQSLQEHERKSHEQLNCVVSKNVGRLTQLQSENSELKVKLKEERDERDKMLEVMNMAKMKLGSERTKFQEVQERDKAEKERLKSELERIQDNFNVLQKINADNTNTISKLRSDLDDHKRHKSEMESEFIEKGKIEQALSSKLRQKEALCMDLEDQVNYLEKQVRAIQHEIEGHDCEEHVESVHRTRLDKLEQLLQSQKVELQTKLETLRSERDQALAAGRRSVQIAQQTKLDCETRILQITASAKEEMTKLQEDKQSDMRFYHKKISDLELELKLARSNADEVQRSLTGRIQQLQTVLTSTAHALCVGGAGAGDSDRDRDRGRLLGSTSASHSTSNSNHNHNQNVHQSSSSAFGGLRSLSHEAMNMNEDSAIATSLANINSRFNEYFNQTRQACQAAAASSSSTTTNPFLNYNHNHAYMNH